MDYSENIKAKTWIKIKEIIDEIPANEVEDLDFNIDEHDDGVDISIDFSIGNTEQENTGTIGYFNPAISVDHKGTKINYKDLGWVAHDSYSKAVDELEKTEEDKFNVNQLTGDIPKFIQDGFNQIAENVTIGSGGFLSKENESRAFTKKPELGYIATKNDNE